MSERDLTYTFETYSVGLCLIFIMENTFSTSDADVVRITETTLDFFLHVKKSFILVYLLSADDSSNEELDGIQR